MDISKVEADEKQNAKTCQESNAKDGPFDNLLKSLSKCKLNFINEKEECKKIKEINTKLNMELKEARELEKSHRYHLLSSREMIGNLQDTVSQLVHLKRDLKKMKEEMTGREAIIRSLEKDKENLKQIRTDKEMELRLNHENQLKQLTANNETTIQRIQNECETQVAQLSCVVEELSRKIKDIELENNDKMNVLVLEYEENIQRGASHAAQLQEQLASQAARTQYNDNLYKRRLEDLEEKLKQSNLKQYNMSEAVKRYSHPVYGAAAYEGERPYSLSRESADSSMHNITTLNDPVLDTFTGTHKVTQNKSKPKLQVTYYDNKPTLTPPQKKGPFNITKKRKLYSDKDTDF